MRSSTGVTSRELASEYFAPFPLRGVVEGAKRDMVHTACAHPAIGELGLDEHIDVIAQGAPICGKAKTSAVLADLVEAHAPQHGNGLFIATLTERHAEEATDRMLGRNIAGTRSLCLSGVRVADNLQPHAIRIGKAEYFFLESLTGAFHRNTGAEQTLLPECK